jgi:hypothetical protein
MAVALRTMRGGTAPFPNTWQARIRWRLVVPILGLSVLFGGIGSTAIAHGAELAQGIEAGRQMVASTGAWLGTAAAQAFTMQCTHARTR